MNNSDENNILSSPAFYNRELSWIDFNERVLGEGLKKELPPLERFKFLSIVSSNFDEFFMVRVAAIKQAMDKDTDISGISSGELLEKIYRKVRSIISRQYDAFINEVFPDLASWGLCLKRPKDWSASQRDYLESFF
ncbi:MAG: polyphosphate kinase 1, partial [Treponema sp.]|nr:polyphosphate kinase 1 [Treponema sp.]